MLRCCIMNTCMCSTCWLLSVTSKRWLVHRCSMLRNQSNRSVMKLCFDWKVERILPLSVIISYNNNSLLHHWQCNDKLPGAVYNYLTIAITGECEVGFSTLSFITRCQLTHWNFSFFFYAYTHTSINAAPKSDFVLGLYAYSISTCLSQFYFEMALSQCQHKELIT